jgi:hypothetical protein
MKRLSSLILIGQLLLITTRILSAQDGSDAPVTDPNASSNCKKLYQYLTGLKYLDSERFLSGQHIHQEWKYYDFCYDSLYRLTGYYPAFLHSQADYPWNPVWRFHHGYHFIYPLFYNHYHHGGVLMLLLNPVFPWNGGLLKQDVPKGDTIASVYTTGTHVNRVYTEYLKIFASGLRLFKKDDIPVIIRLFGENNGNWFWFHHGNEQVSAEAFRELYSYTVDFLRDTLDLHNILFCYEVSDHLNGNTGQRAPYLDGLVPEKTDIMGIQCYHNFNPEGKADPLDLYLAYEPFGKPIMMPQYIRDREEADIDWVSFLEVMKEKNPNIVGFSPWADGPNAKKWGSLVANVNAGPFMEDSWTINRGELTAFPRQVFDELYVPKDEADGTLDMKEGKIIYNFSSSTEGFSNGYVDLFPTIADTAFFSRDNKLNCYFYISEYVAKNSDGAYIWSPYQQNDPAKYSFTAYDHSIVKIRLRNHSTSEKMILTWAESISGEWDEGNRIEFQVESNAIDFKEYTIDLRDHSNWIGTIRRFRLHLAPESVIGSTEIDYIALGDASDFSHLIDSENNSNIAGMVFPNPAFGYLFSRGLEGLYQIVSQNGSICHEGMLEKNQAISIHMLSPGLYYLCFPGSRENCKFPFIHSGIL